MEIIGIVTRLTPFKEKDAMINVVAENKAYSFLARGVLGIASKNMASVQPYTKSRFVLTKGKEGFLFAPAPSSMLTPRPKKVCPD